ncbi:hypothetical protein [Sphingomonas sp.]|uniref:hypothetical protein n=1 Tax=Sphingomonas sp. TaxID=28214 RepID=UPI00289DBD5F|nr:hypothetical protein [Sphingomonas sp.]
MTLALLPPLLAGCVVARPVEGPVRLGQMAAVNGPRVRADRVIEDSRCPVGVQCVRAGRLIVRVTVFGGGWSRVMDLGLGTPVVVADGRLTLVAATRRPYRFTFDFQGGL